MITNVKECIKPISYIKTNAADMMNFVNDRKEPLVMIVLFSVLFMTAAVLCIIRYARIGKKEKEDGKKQPEN